jgi:hypothetical protein
MLSFEGWDVARWVRAGFGAALATHGLVHLLGVMAYLELGRIEALPFKTTLLEGRWDLGRTGTHFFGGLWLLPAIGYSILGLRLASGGTLSEAALALVTGLSLALTLLDWERAFAGAVLDALILAGLLGARFWVAKDLR